MNYLPPIAPTTGTHGEFSKPNFDLSFIYRSLDRPETIFETHIKCDDSFGANELWSAYSGNRRIKNWTFLPDVGIFSTKFRALDLTKKLYFACYSDFSFSGARYAREVLGLPSVPILLRATHPYVAIHSDPLVEGAQKKFSHFSDSALLLLPKSTKAIERRTSFEMILKSIEHLLEFASGVSLCAYYLDSSYYQNFLIRYGDKVRLVSCGSRYDLLFYFRLNLLIRSHKFISYFEPGSHSLYASISERKQFCILGDISIKIINQYHVNRLPCDDELTEFREACKNLEGVSCPTFVPQFKTFLTHSSPVEEQIKHLQFARDLLKYPQLRIARTKYRSEDTLNKKELDHARGCS